MTNEQILAMVQARTGVTDTTLLQAYIDDAGQAIINKAYPFLEGITDVPLKYQHRQVEIAVYLVNKQGAEGQTSHNENGISRSYESASVPKSMLRDVIPIAKIPTTEETDENT